MELWYQEDDRYMGQRMALQKYERYETAMILSQINDDAVVVDVGANIGYYTILMAQRAKKVYAIEPEKNNFEILEKNIKTNNLKNVIAIRAAVGNKNGEVKIVISKENFGDNRVGNGENMQTIKCLRLDDILRNEQIISTIKIDTQGFEPEVIKGAEKIIKRDSPILFLEYNREKYKNDEMIKNLKSKYKDIWSINDFADVPWPIWPGVKVLSKAGYADLWMKKTFTTNDYVTMLKNVNYKKFIKGIMGL